MKNIALLSLSILLFSISTYAQQHSFIFTPKAGIGFADGTSCFAFGADIGYQFSNNRIYLSFLNGSKKRKEYSNGDYSDMLIGNLTSKYARILKTGSISIVPEVGFGLVTGKWEKNSGYFGGESIQSGFGLTFGCGLEYLPTEHVLLKLGYEQALLIGEFTGNGAILFGVGVRIFRKSRQTP